MKNKSSIINSASVGAPGLHQKMGEQGTVCDKVKDASTLGCRVGSDTGQPGVIYVGRTEGDQVLFLGKVGMVSSPEFLEGRIWSYRVADRVFSFVLEAAYAVDVPENSSIGTIEGHIHSTLQDEGMLRLGENFVAPDCNMTFLARRVEAALNQLGHLYRPLDVEILRKRALDLNSAVWEKVRKHHMKGKKGKNSEPDIYQQWLNDHCKTNPSLMALARPRDYVRQVMATGHLLRDLAAGSGIDCIRVPLLMGGCLRIFPTSQEEARFEAKVEADLSLASVSSYTACPTKEGQVSGHPMAMSLLVGQNLERLDISNAFVPGENSSTGEVRLSPDHVAALGYLGGLYNEQCLWEGLGVRARLSPELYEVVRGRPHLLAGIRFWQGIQHARQQGFRIQDFELPNSLEPLWDRAFEAAEELDKLGRPVPVPVRHWASHVWLPTALSSAVA